VFPCFCGRLEMAGRQSAQLMRAVNTALMRDIDIYSFHINSTVTSRYAVTVITSHVSNRLRESSEVHFQVKIPRNAFISKFRMTMEGKTYDGVVKEKEEAQRQYSQAVSRGESAGMVRYLGRTLEEFKTSVAVAASSKVTFELTYEELLIRRLGKYQLLINAQPMQPVADFKVKLKASLSLRCSPRRTGSPSGSWFLSRFLPLLGSFSLPLLPPGDFL
uniref:VIT domain-containing protein n=1 Tax=Pygocentrus nattereri TaxID=42514 RepID=A0A3B4CAN0_PYGNA